MHKMPMIMTRGNMITATEWAKSRVNHIIAEAKELENDDRVEDRTARHLCKACYYSSRIGGAAITTQECMCCGEVQTYGSTSTDALCKPCAIKHSLCKRCGGDLEMRTKRRKWPAPEEKIVGGGE